MDSGGSTAGAIIHRLRYAGHAAPIIGRARERGGAGRKWQFRWKKSAGDYLRELSLVVAPLSRSESVTIFGLHMPKRLPHILEVLHSVCQGPKLVRNYTLAMIAVFTLGLTGTALLVPPGKYTEDYEKRIKCVKVEFAHKLDPENRKLVKDLFDGQLKQYRARTDSILTNSRVMVTLILLSVLLVVSQAERFTIPIIGLKMPRRSMLFILPWLYLFFWLQFGYYLYDAIGSRVALWHIADVLECSTSIPQKFSQRALLDDWGFVDLWFIFSGDQKYVWKESPTGVDWPPLVSVFVGNLAIYGLAQGCLLGLIIETQESLVTSLLARHSGSYLIVITSIGVFLLVTHAGFLYGGYNRNWGQLVIGVFAGVGVLMLDWLKKPSVRRVFLNSAPATQPLIILSPE
jgi:hypothetical protein